MRAEPKSARELLQYLQSLTDEQLDAPIASWNEDASELCQLHDIEHIPDVGGDCIVVRFNF